MPTTSRRGYYYPSAGEKQSSFPSPHAAGMRKIDTDMHAALTGSVAASRVTGTLASARVPNLPASKITSGMLAPARLPAATTSAAGALSAADKAKLDGIPAGPVGDWFAATPVRPALPEWADHDVRIRLQGDGTALLYVDISPYNTPTETQTILRLATWESLPAGLITGPVNTIQYLEAAEGDNAPVFPPVFAFTFNANPTAQSLSITVPAGRRIIGGSRFALILPTASM